ncbi:heavy metal-associated isoprenylated plant protein 39-like [Corylus avellana]|uniref:heavy metal-associated isoprenylated plant protein 39-like n=1 Tax=Corylus avellana TaxID=13451 RepID=UPI001E1F6B16|nr:heavy metal-associated isoprenylated plant protein 39-like [Corylus avellana]
MKKVILKVSLLEESKKRRGMKSVSGLQGVESISMDSKDQKLTVIGDIDPVDVVSKLRKLCHTEILSVGPAKEEKKKEEPKKEEPKKDDKKKDDELLKAYQAYFMAHGYYPAAQQHYFVRSVEEDPNACVIC